MNGGVPFDLKSSTQKSENMPEIETQKSWNLKHLAFLLSEKTYHPDKKIKRFYGTISLCFTMFVLRVLNFLQLLSV